jgi:maleylacetoacetate isomerase
MKLHTYYRSSAAFRVRIALALKGLSYEAVPVHLLRNGGEQHRADYREKSPLGNVPVLEDGGAALTQSIAIIEYLEETHPHPPLMPATPLARARVRAIALSIACDIHPLNNLRVLNYLRDKVSLDETARNAWYRHWVEQGLAGVERLLADSPETGTFCHGDTPGLADCCLVPQVFNARRFECDLSAMPTIRRISTACEALEPFIRAMPANQPDAE